MPDDDQTDIETGAQGGDTDSDDDDFDAQAALSAAAQEADDDSDDDEGDGLDDRTKAKIAKANREAQNLRQRLKELQGSAKELKALKDKDKSEAERLAEERDQLKTQLDELNVANIRREAAAEAHLPQKFARFITAETEDDALAQAKELAKELGLDAKGNKKSPDLRQGNRGPSNAGQNKQNPDDLLRAMARR